jgi:preprotein translocase subunit SecG
MFWRLRERTGALQVVEYAFEGLFKFPFRSITPIREGTTFYLDMIILITIVHIIVCMFLIIVVLLQSGQSGDIAAAFGGMGSQTAFGPRGAATALSKATTWSAIIFMVTSITLSVYASRRGGPKSVLQGISSQPAKTQPAKPAPVPAAPQQK